MSRGKYNHFEPPAPPPNWTPPGGKRKFEAPIVVDTTVNVDRAKKIVKWAEDRTAPADHHFIGVDTTSQPVTITLPRAADIPSGKILLIKDEGGNASNNAITVTTSDGALIDGNSGVSLMADYASINLYYNGAGWHIY